MNRSKIVILLLTLLLTGTISAQNNTFDFLRLDNSPRAASLAGSFVAAREDINVVFYNPAGMMTLQNTPVSISYFKHLEDINSASLAASKEFEGLGRFGASVNYINYGSFVEADIYGNETGEFSAGEFAFAVGYANMLDENFYYGVNLKFIYSGIAEYSSTGLAADLGLMYDLPAQLLTIGFSALNVGAQLSSYADTNEKLPLDIRFGVSKSLQHMPLKFYFSVNRLNEQGNLGDKFSNFTFGGEFRLGDPLRLRIGYDNEKRNDLKTGTSAGLAGFNFGLGVIISDYNFDYAYSPLGSVGAFHRIGLITSF